MIITILKRTKGGNEGARQNIHLGRKSIARNIGEASFWCKISIYQILARYLCLSLSDSLPIFDT
jgi:hypothetical protein